MPQKPTTQLFLSDEEVAVISDPIGSGGFQTFQTALLDQLQYAPDVELTDQQLGKLVRYMTQYGKGGFQSRLNKAFIRPLSVALGLK